MTPLSGTATRNKGMGLFPRGIDGRYAMIERQDNEKSPLDLLRRPLRMGRWAIVPADGVSLGVRADKQLRLTHRTGRRPAVVDAWRRASAEIFHRSGSSRQARLQGSRPGTRAARAARADRAGGLCAKRRLHLRRPAPWRSIILPCAVSDTFSNFSTINTAVLLEALAG